MLEGILIGDNTKTEDCYSASAVNAGEVVNIDGRAGVVLADIKAGATGKAYVDGRFSFPAVEFAMSRGGVLGWDANGTPYGGSTTGAGTTKLAAADFLLGTIIEDMTSQIARIKVDLNSYPTDLVGILGGRKFETVSGAKTLAITDVGKIFCVDTDAFTITLPAVAVEFEFVVMNVMADGACLITIAPNSSDKIMGADLAGVDDKDRLLTKTTSKSNDFIHFVYGSVAGYNVVQERGTWAAEG